MYFATEQINLLFPRTLIQSVSIINNIFMILLDIKMTSKLTSKSTQTKIIVSTLNSIMRSDNIILNNLIFFTYIIYYNHIVLIDRFYIVAII